MPLERYRLLGVECLKVPISVVLFKPAQGFCGCIHSRLAVPLGFLQIGEVFALDPLISGLCLLIVSHPCIKSLFTVGE
jgi:hypothetical protein